MRVCVWVCVCMFVYVCVCLSLPPRLLITSDVIGCDINPYYWLKSLQLYMTAVVGIISR